ncbi:MAG: T9SS type A sorting domain-containing protein, partial [Hymenobacter sp.]
EDKSINKTEFSEGLLRVYPNPTAGSFTTDYTVTVSQAATLILVDNLGRQVYQQSVQLQVGSNRIPVQANHLVAGLYQVILTTAGQQRQVNRIVIVH